jgi:hypothetical protein
MIIAGEYSLITVKFINKVRSVVDEIKYYNCRCRSA